MALASLKIKIESPFCRIFLYADNRYIADLLPSPLSVHKRLSI
jgi:hypothetical protein